MFFDNRHVPSAILQSYRSFDPIAFASPSNPVCGKEGFNHRQIRVGVVILVTIILMSVLPFLVH